MRIGWLIKANLAAVISVCLFQSPVWGQNGRDSDTSRLFLSPQEAARAELDVLRTLNQPPVESDDVEFAKVLGFTSVDETVAAQLGSPFRICSAPLEFLQKFQPGDDPNEFLLDTRQILFPILVNGEARSSLTVEESEGQPKTWQIVKRGSTSLMSLMQKASPNLIRPMQEDGVSSSFLALIIGLRFLGDRKEGELVMTPLDEIDWPLRLKPGDEQPARALFATLAQQIDFKQSHQSYLSYLKGLLQGRETETLTTGGQKC